MPGCGRHDPLSHCPGERPALRKSLKRQPGEGACVTAPLFGIAIAIQLDENKLLTWRTVGFWRLIAERKEQTGGELNHAEANGCTRSVSTDVSGAGPICVEVADWP